MTAARMRGSYRRQASTLTEPDLREQLGNTKTKNA
jgi:hypothetical protein